MSNNGAMHQEVTKIPDMDGTGPRWLGERRFSRRVRWYSDGRPSDMPVLSMSDVQQSTQSSKGSVYGIGRGGLPRGGSRRMRIRRNIK